MIGKQGASEDRKATGAVRVGAVRKAMKLTVFLLIVVGLAVGIGWGSYSSMGVDAIAYLCPLGALEALLAARTAVPRFIVAIAVMGIAVLLLGRAFCAWVCPVPPVEAFFRPRKRRDVDADGELPDGEPADGGGAVVLPSLTEDEKALLIASCSDNAKCGLVAACSSCLTPVGGARDGFKLDTRHGALLGALVGAIAFGFPVFCLVCPVGLSIATVVAVWQAFVGHAPSWSLLVFPLILVVELVVFRKWCHALCPLGALMSLLGRKSLFKPHVSEQLCLRSKGIDCRTCVNVCPEELDPHGMRLPECTKCGACVDACPARAIAMPALSHEKKEKQFDLRKGN